MKGGYAKTIEIGVTAPESTSKSAVLFYPLLLITYRQAGCHPAYQPARLHSIARYPVRILRSGPISGVLALFQDLKP